MFRAKYTLAGNKLADRYCASLRFSASGCLAAVLLACMFFLSATAARAQDSPREVRQKAHQALAQGAYDDAIIYLEQLLSWFGDSKDTRIRREMATVRFNLGLCYFLIGQFEKSDDAFNDYLKNHSHGPKVIEASVYIADGLRFRSKFSKALKDYEKIRKIYENKLSLDWQADILGSMVRCYLAEDNWEDAIPLLNELYRVSPDVLRSSWAATLLTIAYLKEMDLEKVYKLVPYLLQPNSFASWSVAYNVAALEAADMLFAEERYRDALWVYRLIYPHDMLAVRSMQYLEHLNRRGEILKRTQGKYRELMRNQELTGEIETEIEALDSIDNYDIELFFRIARSYMETRRYREARELFLYLYQEADDQQSEEALFLAFHCSTQIRPWDRAFELGKQYLKEFPAGEYYDDVSLTVGQMYAQLQNWPEVIRHLTKVLQQRPKHQAGAECMFLIGYASFMEEKFADAVEWLERMNKKYPGNERTEEGTYWIGMSYLFDKKYEEAYPVFSHYIADYPGSTYIEDATFRRSVCDYGLSRFEKAEKKLLSFVSTYPESILAGEAYMMLGDISGTYGNIKNAVQRFQRAMDYKDLNIELYNYCAFHAAEMMNDDNDYEKMISHFKRYIRKNREGSNIPMAIYWIGRALWQTGEKEGALKYYEQSIVKYGKDRMQLGIDMILEEWIGKTKGVDRKTQLKAWKSIGTIMQENKGEDGLPLRLRLIRAYLYKPNLKEQEKKMLLDNLLKEKNLEYASAAVLELMADEAARLGMNELAVKASRKLIDDFTETDYALTARMTLAKWAIEEKKFDVAIKHLGVIREVFASSSEAGQALVMLGNLYIDKRDYKKAEDCFKDVLSVREWKGPLFPAALYGRGEAARKQNQYERACAYYERIYLLYSHYTQWTAKAYLQRAKCLGRLYKLDKAKETLTQMLSVSDLADTPEGKEARKLLRSL